MSVKLILGMRNQAHRVDVVQPNGTAKPVLGTAHPQEDTRRQDVQKQWGGSTQKPRPQTLATIDEPLPQRAQTTLSYRVDASLRQRLNTGMGRLADSRKRAGEAETAALVPPKS